MTNAVSFDYLPDMACTVELPSNRGVFSSAGMILYQLQSLSTDPVGVFKLTLTNLVVGSVVHIEAVDGTVLVTSVADTSTEVITMQTYAAGSALNNLHVKVRKGSGSPFYRPFETYTTSVVGSQSIYVSQIPEE